VHRSSSARTVAQCLPKPHSTIRCSHYEKQHSIPRRPSVRRWFAGDLDLKGILDAVDNTFLSALQKTIEAKDATKFATAYRQTIEGCYSCHKAAEKPYLRLQIPDHPEAPIINFDPAAKWPE